MSKTGCQLVRGLVAPVPSGDSPTGGAADPAGLPVRAKTRRIAMCPEICGGIEHAWAARRR